jgi:hypothetical protein
VAFAADDARSEIKKTKKLQTGYRAGPAEGDVMPLYRRLTVAPKFKCPLRPGGLKPWTQQLDQRPQKVSSIRVFVEDDRSVRERRPPDLQG